MFYFYDDRNFNVLFQWYRKLKTYNWNKKINIWNYKLAFESKNKTQNWLETNRYLYRQKWKQILWFIFKQIDD